MYVTAANTTSYQCLSTDNTITHQNQPSPQSTMPTSNTSAEERGEENVGGGV